MNIKVLITFFLFTTIASFAFPKSTHAQSVELDSTSIPLNSQIQIPVQIQGSPGAKTAALRIDFPNIVQLNSFTPSGSVIAITAECADFIDGNRLCMDISKIGTENFRSGDILGSLTLTGVSEGTANAVFGTDSFFLGGDTLTGTFATLTVAGGGGGANAGGGTVGSGNVGGVSSGSGTLPESGLFGENETFITLALVAFLAAMALLINLPKYSFKFASKSGEALVSSTKAVKRINEEAKKESYEEKVKKKFKKKNGKSF